MDGLHPYSDYKDSGLPWLGRVPAHWQIARTKRHYRLRTEKSPANHGQELLSIYTHIGVRPRKELEQKGNKATTTDGYWVVKRGDIIVNKLLAWMGAIGVSHYDGVTSPAYDIVMPVSDDVAPDYHHYLFRTVAYLQQFKSRSRGIMDMRLRLYFDQLGQIPLLVPPRTEQSAIVRFLDAHSRLVNRFIRNRRRLIEVLNEQKQAIVDRAVMHGVRKSARLKPFRVDLLGNVPAHWSVQRLRHLANVRLSSVDKIVENREIPVLLCNYVDVYRNGEITDAIPFMQGSATPAEIAEFSLKQGDVLITKDSEDWQDIAVPAYVPKTLDEVLCGYHLALIRPQGGQIDGEYLARAFTAETIADQFRIAANGVTRYGLPQTAIKGAYFPAPPPVEQREIVSYIRTTCSRIDSVIARTEKQIDLIREYRTRLISDVVTGKRDVRGVTSSSAEPEPAERAELDADELRNDHLPEVSGEFIEEALDID